MSMATLRITAFLVAATLPAVAQEMEDIRGPKPLIEVTQPEQPVWLIPGLIGLGVLVAVMVGIAVVLLIRDLRRGNSLFLSPEEKARKELNRLRSEGESIPADIFAEAASGVLRRFIERRFGVAAPRRTTEEFLHEVTRGAHGLEDRIEGLRGFLRACDLAKFAGEDLDKLQREDLLLKARGFVNEPVREAEA